MKLSVDGSRPLCRPVPSSGMVLDYNTLFSGHHDSFMIPSRFMSEIYPIPKRRRIELALEARVDVRTIEAELRGVRVGRDAGERAREALKAANLPTSETTAA